MPASGDHYFATEPATPSEPAEIELHLPDLSFRLQTDRGVFSGSEVDPGTRHLLLSDEAHPRRVQGGDGPTTLADLGCGYGPIALALARRAPGATVWAVDVNQRARQLCAANAAANGLTNVVVADPGDVPGDLRLDGLWSNPPIRIGKPALHDLLSSWLARLRPGGRAWMVVHRHLGSDSLARWLTAQGWPARRLSSRQGYRVLEVAAAAAP